MSVWQQALVVFRKEVIDAFRDRRALASISSARSLGPSSSASCSIDWLIANAR